MLRQICLSILIGCLLSVGGTLVYAQDTAPAVTEAETTPETITSESAPEETTTAPKVAFIHIEEMIDEWQARYVSRAIDDAIANDVDYIVTHIDTYGGRVDSAESIFIKFLSLDGPDDPKCIAFIDEKAISAGALIAYGHHEIHMTPAASIGDIGVIFVNEEGVQYAPEKMVSPIRANLLKAASLRGWNAAFLQKMTDRNQELYKVKHKDGKVSYVIEEKLPQFLQEHPDIDIDDTQQFIAILGKDRLVTKFAKEAVELNIATSLVDSLDEVYANIGASKSDLVDLNPTGTESLARTLGAWAPLFLSLTILFIMFEVKTAGVGMFAALAAVTGTLFFICNYYQDLASYFEIFLIVLGLALVGIEFFTMITGGILAIIGGMVAFLGIFLTFMPENGQFDFDSPFYFDYLSNAATNSVLVFFVAVVGLILFLIAAPKIPAFQRLAVQAEIEGTSEASNSSSDTLVGKTATALTQLRPSGQIQTEDGMSHSATVKHGAFVDEGQQVLITDHRYGDLIVEAVKSEEES